ncbi:hypothetical protein ACET3Z_027381 [Daucus carota]
MGLSGEDEGFELVLAIKTERGSDKGGNFGEGIGGENNQGGLGGFRDGDEFGSKLCENENQVSDRDWKGFINDGAKFEERKSEKLGGVEGNEGHYKEMKEGGEGKDGSKWSEIENEGGDRELEGIKNEAEIKERNSEKRCVVEGNVGDTKEMNEGEDNEGSKWSEIENEDGDLDLEGIKDEAEIEERNLKKMEKKGIEDEMAIEERDPDNRSVVEGNGIGSNWIEIGNKGGDCDLKGKEIIEDYEDGWGENWDDGAEAEEDSGSSNDENFGRRHYPLRPDVEACSLELGLAGLDRIANLIIHLRGKTRGSDFTYLLFVNSMARIRGRTGYKPQSHNKTEVLQWLKTLSLAPEFHPTLEEFKDPIAYIHQIEKEASVHGICKIIPPVSSPSMKTSFLQLNNSLMACSASPKGEFTTRVQQAGFCQGKGHPVIKSVTESGKSYTVSEFEAKAKSFERNYFEKSSIDKGALSPLEIESLYWKDYSYMA